jgi:hypothetical protein
MMEAMMEVFNRRRFSVGLFCGWCAALGFNTLAVLLFF